MSELAITMGSLFDGSGGFPEAARRHGMTPVFASEVEPYPIAVTRSRFPGMKPLGNILTLRGDLVTPVDVVTFGSPCQDLSVAGKQAGIHAGTRSNLFFEAIRFFKEMREKTHGKYPRIVVWENVPGAFSSHKGEDFRAVLQALAEIGCPEAAIPMPEKGKWAKAGCIVGDGWSIAWRTYDAQFWGVPQRRKRIYLIADFGSERAGEILFEREGVRGHFAPSGAQGQETAENAQGNPASDDRERIDPTVCIKTYDARGNGDGNVVNTITGDHENRITDYTSLAVETHPVYSLQGNAIDRNAQQNGSGICENVSHTVNAVDRHGVAYCVGNGQLNQISMAEQANTLDCMHDQQAVVVFDKEVYNSGINSNGGHHVSDNGIAPTLRTMHPPGVATQYIVRRLTPTECARLQGFPDTWGHPDKKDSFTPEEYAFWLEVRNTHAAINGKQVKDYTEAQMLKWYNGLHTDSAEYKMWGNGIALPCAEDVMGRIAKHLRREWLDTLLGGGT